VARNDELERRRFRCLSLNATVRGGEKKRNYNWIPKIAMNTIRGASEGGGRGREGKVITWGKERKDTYQIFVFWLGKIRGVEKKSEKDGWWRLKGLEEGEWGWDHIIIGSSQTKKKVSNGLIEVGRSSEPTRECR